MSVVPQQKTRKIEQQIEKIGLKFLSNSVFSEMFLFTIGFYLSLIVMAVMTATVLTVIIIVLTTIIMFHFPLPMTVMIFLLFKRNVWLY